MRKQKKVKKSARMDNTWKVEIVERISALERKRRWIILYWNGKER